MSGRARAAFGARALPALAAGVGSAAMIGLLLLLHRGSGLALLIPSFGASCALVFGVPDSPFARPQSVIGGHLVSSAMGLIALSLMGSGSMAQAIGVGLAIATMMLTRTMHPPAGGDPLIVILAGATPMFLLTPILAGAVLIVMAGAAFGLLRRKHAR